MAVWAQNLLVKAAETDRAVSMMASQAHVAVRMKPFCALPEIGIAHALLIVAMAAYARHPLPTTPDERNRK
jgi:hypothetical protein